MSHRGLPLLAGQGPSKTDCRYLLALPTDSLEIEVTRGVANTVAR